MLAPVIRPASKQVLQGRVSRDFAACVRPSQQEQESWSFACVRHPACIKAQNLEHSFAARFRHFSKKATTGEFLASCHFDSHQSRQVHSVSRASLLCVRKSQQEQRKSRFPCVRHSIQALVSGKAWPSFPPLLASTNVNVSGAPLPLPSK